VFIYILPIQENSSEDIEVTQYNEESVLKVAGELPIQRPSLLKC